VTLILSAAILAAGCSKSTEPKPEAEPGPYSLQGYPAIPSAQAIADGARFSDTLTSIRPLTLQVPFTPTVKRARLNWTIDLQKHDTCSFVNCVSDWTTCQRDAAWSDEIAPWSGTFQDCGLCDIAATVQLGLSNPWKRVEFVKDGALRGPSPESHYIDGNGVHLNYKWTHVPLANPVYLRRDRFWLRLPVFQGADVYLITGGSGDSYSREIEYTSGVDSTTIDEIGVTVTGTVGTGDKAKLKLQLEVAINRSHSTSVRIYSETTVREGINVAGVNGKTRMLTYWGAVDLYTFTDAEGRPYSDPVYEFPVMDLQLDNVAGHMVVLDL